MCWAQIRAPNCLKSHLSVGLQAASAKPFSIGLYQLSN
jgi:hypothetical protein